MTADTAFKPEDSDVILGLINHQEGLRPVLLPALRNKVSKYQVKGKLVIIHR